MKLFSNFKSPAFLLVCFLVLLESCFHVTGRVWKTDKYFIEIQKNSRSPNNALRMTLGPNNGKPQVTGVLGLSLPDVVAIDSECESSAPGSACYQFGDYAKFELIPPSEDDDSGCGRIEWTSPYSRRLDDCFLVTPDVHWYGGGETYTQRWPVEVQSRSEVPFITGDHLNNNSFFAGGVLEKYWLASNGLALFFDDDVPLYYSVKTDDSPEICFTSKDDHPYSVHSPLTMKYSFCIGDNLLLAHKKVQRNFFETPTSIPEEQMLLYPLWSSWAQYHSAVNQSIVLEFSRRVVSEGFTLSSHIEIDDNWEPCYGQETFHPDKFPNPKAMIDEIHDMGLNVTVWVHPFVNYNCPLFQEGISRGYFVRDTHGKPGISSWWAGGEAGAIDVTNPEAVQWWHDRLRKLKQDTGVSSFKFDAGETNWLPYHFSASGDYDPKLLPNLYTTKFVEACSEFGGLIETRAAHRNQDKGIFIRMMDKDSSWSYGNGLRSMIPTLFHFGILGYPFVLPDMIGGNAYGGRPSKELYVRWMQANVLMPSVQISIVPWDFDEETVALTKEVLVLRNGFKEQIIQAARQAMEDGSPMNRPLWWLDPEDSETYTIDTEYSLGNNVIVAPVLDEDSTSRDIYLPSGTWESYPDHRGVLYEGPQWLRNYQVPLNTVPIFIRVV